MQRRLHRDSLCRLQRRCHSRCTFEIVKLFLDMEPNARRCDFHKSNFQCYIDVRIHNNFRRKSTLNIDILKLFLDRGANVHQTDSLGFSALFSVLHNFDCNADVLQLLLDAGASMNGCSLHGSALMCYMATKEVKSDVIKLFLDRGGDAHEVSLNGNTPLHKALKKCQYEVAAIEMLIDHPGFDANKRDKNEDSYLHCALKNSYCKRSVVKLLLNRGVRADAVDSEGYTLLQILVEEPCCDKDIIKMLLDNGCSVVALNEGCHPLFMIEKVPVDVIRLLLTAGGSLNAFADTDEPTLLYWTLTMYSHGIKEFSLDCLLLFLKYAVLTIPHLDINKMIQEKVFAHKQNALLNYVSRCVNEIKHIDVLYVAPGVTLKQFAASQKNEVAFDFNVLLKILASNEFPIYFDIISARLERVLTESKLRESHMYLVYDLPCKGKRKIVLDSDSTCRIGSFLSDDDLLSYLVVCYASHPY